MICALGYYSAERPSDDSKPDWQQISSNHPLKCQRNLLSLCLELKQGFLCKMVPQHYAAIPRFECGNHVFTVEGPSLPSPEKSCIHVPKQLQFCLIRPEQTSEILFSLADDIEASHDEEASQQVFGDFKFRRGQFGDNGLCHDPEVLTGNIFLSKVFDILHLQPRPGLFLTEWVT